MPEAVEERLRVAFPAVRSVLLQVPDGKWVATVRVRLAPGALTAVVLDPR